MVTVVHGLMKTNKVGKFTLHQEPNKNTPPPPQLNLIYALLVNDTFYRFSFSVFFPFNPYYPLSLNLFYNLFINHSNKIYVK